ncbi:MAG: helix-turn-helix domain-containing protein [Clostridiales bacterium]|jgi:hypothetical protein|nr:helix-turn-helix domain-containing protein [Clostridiales bacterium]
MTLYETVMMLAKSFNIEISQLEKNSGLSNGSINRWTVQYPRTEVLTKVAKYFNVSIDFLVGISEVPTIAKLPERQSAEYPKGVLLSPKEGKLICNLRKLDETNRQAILNHADALAKMNLYTIDDDTV